MHILPGCPFNGASVKIEIDGVASKPETLGHRFHAPGAIRPKDFADYAAKLRDAKVLIEALEFIQRFAGKEMVKPVIVEADRWKN